MVFFDGIINLISNSSFYICYVSQWPEPFNIVSFDAVLLIILLILGIRAVWNAVNSYRFSVRFKAKRQKLQEERIEQEMRERERDKHREEDNDIIRQYLKFLSVASAHNILGTNPISLEEFKLAIQNDKETNISGAECSESVPDQEKTSDISPGVLSCKTDEMPEKKPDPVVFQENVSENDQLEQNASVSDAPADADADEKEVQESPTLEKEDTVISDILMDNGIDPSVQGEVEEKDPMSETEFSRIMAAISRNETAKNEVKKQEEEKREEAEKKMADLDEQMAKNIGSMRISAVN